jgi:transposase-like protein
MPKPSVERDPDEETESEARERARGASGSSVESVAKRRKRSFSAAERLRIIQRADACLQSGKRGAMGAMLREEGLYSSQLSVWRAQLSAHGTEGLHARTAGRKPKMDAKDRAYAALEKSHSELERKLRMATVLIDLQKKAHELLGIALPESEENA